MKLLPNIAKLPSMESHPVRGAWIEIKRYRRINGSHGSHPVRGAWIEMISPQRNAARPPRSHPVRGAWIEIPGKRKCNTEPPRVAPREGCVD